MNLSITELCQAAFLMFYLLVNPQLIPCILLWDSFQSQGCFCLTFLVVPLQSSLPPAALFVLSKASGVDFEVRCNIRVWIKSKPITWSPQISKISSPCFPHAALPPLSEGKVLIESVKPSSDKIQDILTQILLIIFIKINGTLPQYEQFIVIIWLVEKVSTHWKRRNGQQSPSCLAQVMINNKLLKKIKYYNWGTFPYY